MEVIKQYIFIEKQTGNPHILYQTKDNEYYRTFTGAFGQRDMTIVGLTVEEADAILNPTPPASNNI